MDEWVHIKCHFDITLYAVLLIHLSIITFSHDDDDDDNQRWFYWILLVLQKLNGWSVCVCACASCSIYNYSHHHSCNESLVISYSFTRMHIVFILWIEWWQCVKFSFHILIFSASVFGYFYLLLNKQMIKYTILVFFCLLFSWFIFFLPVIAMKVRND